MKEFKKIAIFIGIMFLSVFITDRVVGLILKNIFISNYSGQSGGKINYYLRKNINPALLIMGDSRTLNQIIPDSFNVDAFNIGHAGMDEVFQEALLDLIITKGKRPKYILLNLEPSFYIYKNGSENFREKATYLKPFYGQSPVLTNYIDSSGPYEKIKFFFSSYKYNNIVLNIIKNKIQNKIPTNKGFDPIQITNLDSIRTKLSLKNVLKTENITRNPLCFLPLTNIINMCKKNRIQLICYTAPIYKEKDLTGLQKINFSIDSVCKKYSINYLDYTNNLKSKNSFGNIALWHDYFHLNEEGAKIFSGIISHSVDSLISAPSSKQ